MQNLHERKFVVVYVMWGPTVNYKILLKEEEAMRQTYKSTLHESK